MKNIAFAVRSEVSMKTFKRTNALTITRTVQKSQEWRSIVARADGHVVSANHGPSTRTNSMVSHSNVAVALEGMQKFVPLVAFDIPPARSLLTALMLWDLNFAESTSNPNIHIDHPMCLFIENAVHGGIWRCPYSMDSVGQISFAIGKFFVSHGKSPVGSV